MGHRARRADMVATQLRARGITDERVLAAMEAVPRHRFVPRHQRRRAHDDRALGIGHGQTISQPWVVARMVEALELGPDDVVLDVGAGSGYATAVLARLAGRVVAVEQDPDLAERARGMLVEEDHVRVVHGDGRDGSPADAPFDAVHVAAAATDVPPALLDQLGDGGRLVMPVGPRTSQHLLVMVRHGEQVHQHDLGRVRFVPLLGGDDVAG